MFCHRCRLFNVGFNSFESIASCDYYEVDIFTISAERNPLGPVLRFMQAACESFNRLNLRFNLRCLFTLNLLPLTRRLVAVLNDGKCKRLKLGALQ